MPDDTFVFHTTIGDYTFHYSNPAQLNQLWGQIIAELGDLGVMGEHSSAAGAFTPDPGDGGRAGAGNVSMDNLRFQFPDGDLTDNNLADGGQGLHAVFQAARLGDPNLPPEIIEATIGPLFAESNGQITVTFVPSDLLI